MENLTAIETFCGAGGMSLGLIEAGIDVRLAFDINEMAVKTYNENIADHCLVLDASKVSGLELLEKANLHFGDLDILTGGPPCQGFSKQKKGAHLLQDERNVLVLHYARLVEETGARSFIFENVEVFGQKRGKALVEAIKERLSQYEIYTFFVCASDFGLAQKRGRFLMIGVRKDCSNTIPIIEKQNKNVSIKDVIGHLPPPPSDYTEHSDFPNHIQCKITKLNVERFSHVPPGGGWQDIPYSLRLPCHQVADPTKGGWPDVYGRLKWEEKSPTITAGFDSFTRGRYGHPEQHRALTLHEGALLQGFPPKFKFHGTRHDIRLQIGNAVAPPVAKAAAQALIRALSNKLPNEANLLHPTENENQLQLAV